MWGLPIGIVEAVAWHHRPNDSLTTTFCPLTAVHVADALTEETVSESNLDLDYLSRLGLQERVPCWQDMAGAKREAQIPR